MIEVSFVIPCKNRAHTIAGAVRSCIEQTYKKNEVIVIDDGSTDWTEELMDKMINGKTLDDKLNKGINGNIIYKKLVGKSGVAAARNYGNELARGKYVAILDSDDCAFPRRAYLIKNFFEKNKNVDFMYGAAQYLFLEGQPVYAAKPFDKKVILNENFITNSTVAYRSEIAKKYKYDESYSCVEDYEFILRLLKNKVKFGMVKQILAGMSMSSSSLNNTDKKYNENRKRISETYAAI